MAYATLAVKEKTNTEGDMMFKCVDCGHIFAEGEQDTWYEDRGEFWGVPCSERVSGCPTCRGDYEEVHRCKRCDEWHFDDELNDGYCELCEDELFN